MRLRSWVAPCVHVGVRVPQRERRPSPDQRRARPGDPAAERGARRAGGLPIGGCLGHPATLDRRGRTAVGWCPI